jgi:rare lipoprotein A
MGFVRVGAGLSVIARVGAVAGCCVALANCSQGPGKLDPKYGVSASPRLVAFGQPVPKGGGTYRVGTSYTIGGRTYNPEENPTGYTAEGTASWYGEDFHGRQTANGEIYDMMSISAAHPTLPIPSYARVTNLVNHRSIIVRVNDRGPYHQGRLIDVSARTAKLLGFQDVGTTRVRVDYVGRASLQGSDDTRLEATLRRGTPAPGPGEVKVALSRAFQREIESAVPVPPDRPFELGQDGSAAQTASRASHSERSAVARAPVAPAKTRTASATSYRTAGAEEPQTSFASRFSPAGRLPAVSGHNGPVSAFAPTESANGAVMSGRGLY